MTEQDGNPAWKSSTRGESAWKEAKESVASRNEQARKSGKQRREKYERERQTIRDAAEARRHAKLLGGRRKP